VNNMNDRLPLLPEALAASTRCNQPMFESDDAAAAEGSGLSEAAEPAAEVEVELAADLTDAVNSPPDTILVPRPKPEVGPNYAFDIDEHFPDADLAEGDAAFFRSDEGFVLALRDAASADLWRVGIDVSESDIGLLYRIDFLDGWEGGEWRRALTNSSMEVIFPFQIGQNPVYDFFFSQSNVICTGTYLKCAA
jgi:hypothetical protein